ncbi:hypothetical protein ABUT75_002419 [Flavobacterium psychrophilum]
MKYFTILVTILIFSTAFSQNQKITNYSLGRLFEKIKTTDYVDYKGNCQGYIDNVMFDYAIKFLDDSNMNNNTLKRQFKNEAIQGEYQHYLDKIVSNYDKNIDYYRSNNEDCPQKRFILFKNHLIAYEMTSKYYIEIYNNEIERLDLINEYNQKYSMDSLKVVQDKEKENLDRLNKNKIEYANLETEGNFKSKKDEYETNISALDLTFEALLEKLENDKILRIKKLTPASYKVNKTKIISEIDNKIKTANQQNENEKNLLTSKYQNSLKLDEVKYQPKFDKLTAENNQIMEFNYESIIPNREDVDDSKFREKRDTLKNKLKEEWIALFSHMNEIYKPALF